MTETFVSAIERLSGYEVFTYQSQILFDPDHVVEMFVLGPPLTVPSADGP